MWVPREFLSLVLRSELPPELDGIEPTRNQVPNRGSWFGSPGGARDEGGRIRRFRVEIQVGDVFWERDLGHWHLIRI